MRSTRAGAAWIHRIWLNSDDLATLRRGNALTVDLSSQHSVDIQPSTERRVRVARIDDSTARLHLPHPVIDSMADGARRAVKGSNGALPLSLTLSVEPGVGVPEWLTEATLDW